MSDSSEREQSGYITCKNCGEFRLTSARFCPHCGAASKPESEVASFRGILVVLGILVMICILLLPLGLLALCMSGNIIL